MDKARAGERSWLVLRRPEGGCRCALLLVPRGDRQTRSTSLPHFVVAIQEGECMLPLMLATEGGAMVHPSNGPITNVVPFSLIVIPLRSRSPLKPDECCPPSFLFFSLLFLADFKARRFSTFPRVDLSSVRRSTLSSIPSSSSSSRDIPEYLLSVSLLPFIHHNHTDRRRRPGCSRLDCSTAS